MVQLLYTLSSHIRLSPAGCVQLDATRGSPDELPVSDKLFRERPCRLPVLLYDFGSEHPGASWGRSVTLNAD